ncbi:hypothetical protein Q7P37_009056 [Cladosporium fusiforme]
MPHNHPTKTSTTTCCPLRTSNGALSPTPPEPARPLYVRPTNHIFALAALPEDHPHALRLPQRRAPKLAKSIVRSPSLASKLRGQLLRGQVRRRASVVRSLRAEVCDCEEVEGRGGLSPLHSSPDLTRFDPLSPVGSVARRVRSAFNLGAAAPAAGKDRLPSEVSDPELRDLAHLNLDLAAHQFDGVEDRSSEGLPELAEGLGAGEGPVRNLDAVVDAGAPENSEDETLIVPERSQDDSTLPENVPVPDASVDSDNERVDSPTSFHLSKKHISQQLRSKSQLSAPSEEAERLTSEAWSFHRRERSNCGTSMSNVTSVRSRHAHRKSDSGVDSSHVPISWGKVNVCCDSSSSIYSRPMSPEMPEPYEIPADLAAVADWPLTGEALPSAGVQAKLDSGASETVDETHITIVEPALPGREVEDTTSMIREQDEGGRSSSPHREPSYRSNSSSTAKSTRFLERFTPPKKLVRKRRSIFKFLRAGSRRQQTRSISTPVLCSPSLRPCVHGPADDNYELLTVQYELVGTEGNPIRSVSLNALPAPAVNEAQTSSSSPDLHRKQSLAEYERHLSVVGDNRRRPSAWELKRLSQIEEDEHHHEPAKSKNTFSLYSQTQETDPLMAAALQRQMQEKALFRSTSKRSVPVSEGSSLSFLATSWDEPSQAGAQSPERDPLDSSRKPGDYHLSPPRTPVGSRSRTSSFSNQKQAGGKKPIVLHTPSSISRDSTTSRIGSSLDSWTRFPSHSRAERSASAGAADNVRARDFAIDDTTERGKDADEPDPFNLSKRVFTKRSTKSSKKSLPKSRSATFGSFVRYYSNLFTSSPDFHGKGRRTSVVAGGTLRHPELEILPPVLSTPAKSQSALRGNDGDQQHRSGNLARIKENTEEGPERVKESLLHDHHLSAFDNLAANKIAFRGNSVFAPLGHDSRKGATVEDLENVIASDEPSRFPLSAHEALRSSPAGLQHRADLDGTAETSDPVKRPSPSSKAQAWSEAYQDCLVIPPSPEEHVVSKASSGSPTKTDSEAMPSPILKPTKRGSPIQQNQQPSTNLDPTAAIRRFPSVTVVDDRKGHWRSVSFISVKSSKSGASGASFVRESSNDLLKLMETRERKEREKLLRAVV